MRQIRVELAIEGSRQKAQEIFDSGVGTVDNEEVLKWLVAICRREGVELTAWHIGYMAGEETPSVPIEYGWVDLQDTMEDNMHVFPMNDHEDEEYERTHKLRPDFKE